MGLVAAAALIVVIARWLVGVPAVHDFILTYPGMYDPPPTAPVGIHAWLNWQHFLNIFFMVLIIRTGLTAHYEKRPTVHWSPRGNPARRVSLAVWLHQSLDILWIVNGALFIVLLFTSGQWMRIVPTSWQVIPNAISAGLQYASLDWPGIDPWTNYNSLQQVAYFATVFMAAPLAAMTGVRMSGVWPKNAKRLSKIYPVEWARAVHFPVMIYFVLFIIVHVALVMLEGMRRNLNVMFAARHDDTGWAGFWLFVAAMIVVAVGWVATRPLVLAPVARLFGRVSGR